MLDIVIYVVNELSIFHVKLLQEPAASLIPQTIVAEHLLRRYDEVLAVVLYSSSSCFLYIYVLAHWMYSCKRELILA